MARAELKQDATEARIASLSLPTGGTWATAARADALARLRALGLPARRDEYWKYTRPDTLIQPEAPLAAVFDSKEPIVFDGIDRLRIVFVDGVFDAAASDDLALAGVEIERLHAAAAVDIHWARDLYGQLEQRGQVPVERPLAALNTAFATDGVLIRVTGRAAKPVNMIYTHESESSDAILHHVVKVEAGAELTLLETDRPPRASTRCGRWMSRMVRNFTISAHWGATTPAARPRISLPGSGRKACSNPSP